MLGENGRVSALEVGGEAIPCDGIFFAKNSTAPKSLLFGLETDGKNIVVDRAMKTNLPGVFAAGDCTGRPYQYTKAVGEGKCGSTFVYTYLSKSEK